MNNIIVTGMGSVSAAGLGNEKLWRAVLDKKSLATLSRFKKLEKYTGHIVCQLPDAVYSEIANLDYSLGMIKLAFAEANNQAEDIFTRYNRKRIGMAVGTTTLGWGQWERDYIEKKDVSLLGSNIYCMKQIKEKLGINGIVSLISTACASSNEAVGVAVDYLKANQADCMIVIGVDAINEYPICGFNALKLADGGLCKPFDESRKSVVLGEGCGILILEKGVSVKSYNNDLRKAEIIGYAENCDAFDMTKPSSESISYVIQKSIQNSNCHVGEIDFILAHATGTIINDTKESEGISNVFKENQPIVTSIKGVIGHTQGAAGIMNIIVGIMALQHNSIPSCAGYSRSGNGIDNIRVLKETVHNNAKVFISNSFGFGGANSCIVVRK